jgi:hypothetical protein
MTAMSTPYVSRKVSTALASSFSTSTLSSNGHATRIDGGSFVWFPQPSRFTGIFRLRVELDYAVVTAGITPFSLDGIERQKIGGRNEFESFRWLDLLRESIRSRQRA